MFCVRLFFFYSEFVFARSIKHLCSITLHGGTDKNLNAPEWDAVLRPTAYLQSWPSRAHCTLKNGDLAKTGPTVIDPSFTRVAKRYTHLPIS